MAPLDSNLTIYLGYALFIFYCAFSFVCLQGNN